jgi:FkbM family methyltransferase
MKHQDLIFDVGLHRGEDTDFYLRKGFRVIAFEADPDHANYCRVRFAQPIAQRRLIIIEGAIVERDAVGQRPDTVSFFKNNDVSVWGTVCPLWRERNEQVGSYSQSIQVKRIDFADVLSVYGVPHYLKIDIEGCDLICVESLKQVQDRPDYISIESDKTSIANLKHEIDLLRELGYTAFQAVEQSAVMSQSPAFPSQEGDYVPYHFEPGASGLFGAELTGHWKSRDQIVREYRLIHFGYYLLGDNGILTRWNSRGGRYLQKCCEVALRRLTNHEIPGWYDTHARL